MTLPPPLARLVGLLFVALPGCATPPPKSDTIATSMFYEQNDPVQPLNRKLYAFNDGLDNYFVSPAAKTYTAATPLWFRTHVGDFTTNLGGPRELIEFMAAGKPRDAGTMLVRFIMNSTIGLGGIFDPASALGYKPVHTDLGLVFAGYGVGEGPYLYVPLSGPSTLRDSVASIGSIFLSPLPFAPKGTAGQAFSYSASILGTVNTRAELNPVIDNVRATALDPYATFRSLYRQHRADELRQIDMADTPTKPDWVTLPRRDDGPATALAR